MGMRTDGQTDVLLAAQ